MNQPISRKRIAIIGAGISGLGAAYLLHPHHDITVFEKNAYIGGHSRTVDVPAPEGNVPVDTGFIVFNTRNYPLLTSLFAHLQVPIAKSCMSFGASIENGWMEYSTQKPQHMFAQKANLLRPAFWRMIADILAFNRKASRYLQSDPALTLGECLDELKLGPWFRDYYLLAMGGAIWSMPLQQMLAFPAKSFIRFFANHGLLTVNDQPQWYTVEGGSREYIKRLAQAFSDRIQPDCGITKAVRDTSGVTLHTTQGETVRFDEVVFACHADQALEMIDSPTGDEQQILSQMRYQPNRVVLHSDESFMPKRRNAWASWVYLSGRRKDTNNKVSLSYWMNNLQPLATRLPIIATLNPAKEPRKELTYDEYWFDHPVFDEAAIRAQERIGSLQGQNRFWFCGAYQRYGFHEDGLLSAVTMADKMGVKPSWN